MISTTDMSKILVLTISRHIESHTVSQNFNLVTTNKFGKVHTGKHMKFNKYYYERRASSPR